jgi:aminoglycoside/choline kinase family phosphotransferase
MLKNEKIYWIDFQDARLGSPVYDLASLLFDAYVPITDAFRKNLVQVYQSRLSIYSVAQELNWNRFEEELYLMAYQRTLKAAGSFASFWTRYQKNSHLVYLKPALQMAKVLEEKAGVSKDVTKAFEVEKMLGLLDGKKDH